MSERTITDSTIARMAGNIVGHLITDDPRLTIEELARTAVVIARAIASEVESPAPDARPRLRGPHA